MFSNWLTSTSAVASSALQTNTPPPDVILEIGPFPFTRFAAHSTILVAHSGYMRSVLRSDERIAECPIYVPNITAEYFAPLLTYMYTGFLDLNIENIFGVLLATHVLHMPRTLEICRNFLARMQADEYSSGIFSKILPHSSRPNFDDSVKVVRPIASKATNSGLAFVAPPISKPLHQSQVTSFKSLNLSVTEDKVERAESANECNEKIDVEKECESPREISSQIVDVDRISPKTEINTGNNERLIVVKKPVKFRKRTHSNTNKTIDIAKSPKDTDSNDESCELQSNNDAAKIIVDIASCDGPVRFQRVLNTAYGRYPLKAIADEEEFESHSYRQMNVKNSINLQLAKNILAETGRTDTENSEDIVLNNNQTDEHLKMERLEHKNLLEGTTSKSDGDVYICVYCNHIFKSQYCYQKHAKRHINPLSLDGGSGIDSDRDDKSENSSSTANAHISTPSIATPTTTPSNQSLLTKREVRPLDMNVQYYPCKTCGSKFPSYYFVHKHRKLCHANEEN